MPEFATEWSGKAAWKTLFVLALLDGLSAPIDAAINLNSGDAYIRSEGNGWVLGTSQAEMRLGLKKGRLSLTSFRNQSSRREYRDGGPDPEQIRFTVDGQDVSEQGWSWSLVSDHASRLSQNELQLDLVLRSGPVGATQHYVVYPKTGLIRQWVTIRNESQRPVRIGNLHFLHTRLFGVAPGDSQLYYVTGGGNYNGSQLLKSEPVSRAYHRTFDSHDGAQKESYSAYLPLLFVRSEKGADGLAFGWDYLGHWRFDTSQQMGESLNLSLTVAGFEKALPSGAVIESPKAFLAAFNGNIDDLGNRLLDWQYEYLWDFTNANYFAKTRWAVDWPSPWVGDGGTPSADNWGRRLALDLRYVDLMRETGTDILWDDAGWYDNWGSWNGPDWRRTNDYLQKHAMKWVLWYPTFLATPKSSVAQAHPEWLVPGRNHLEQSIAATEAWQKRLLDDSVATWGDYQWRYDIAPAVSANETDYLASDQNFRKLLEEFKTAHPRSGIDACYGGGRWISYDIARFAESGEYTDGGTGPYSAYYTSLLVPPDKLHNVVDFDHTYYQPGSDRTHLSMDPTWYRDPGDGPDLEAIRKDWEIFHYLEAQGVVGRWSHVFRPKVENDDPIWYFQRMNRDGSKGVILTKHSKRGPEYFVLSQPDGGGSGAKDEYRGAPGGMNVAVTSGVATLDTGIYEDLVDGAPRYYGAAGEAFGPVNFRYETASGEQPFISSLVKIGSRRRGEKRFFGMAIQLNHALVMTQLGQFDPGMNTGSYTLRVVRAGSNEVMGTAKLDMAHASMDANGFKYAKLDHPIRLEGSSRPLVIHPKGLIATQSYEVTSDRSGLRAVKLGSDWMSGGISLDEVAPGEIIYLNIPRRPGSGLDKIPPDPPAQATKRRGTNLGVQGIEIAWTPAHDDNWISYYEVLKDGRKIATVAKGTFFFDHSDTARESLNSRYEVRTVDGDGNRSPLQSAREIPSDPESYEALGDFGPTQGRAGWKYEELAEDGSRRDLVWDKGGYEGRWVGSGLGIIGRIWMQPSAAFDLSRTFVVPRSSILSASGTIRRDPSAPSGTPLFVRILQNDRIIWPGNGWAEAGSDFARPLEYKLDNIAASKGDQIRFVVKRNGVNRPEPILWNPAIVVREASGK